MKSQFPETIKGSQTKIDAENALQADKQQTKVSLPELEQDQEEVDKEKLR